MLASEIKASLISGLWTAEAAEAAAEVSEVSEGRRRGERASEQRADDESEPTTDATPTRTDDAPPDDDSQPPPAAPRGDEEADAAPPRKPEQSSSVRGGEVEEVESCTGEQGQAELLQAQADTASVQQPPVEMHDRRVALLRARAAAQPSEAVRLEAQAFAVEAARAAG